MDHAVVEAAAVETQQLAASPRWPDITDEILCPLCEYNLRGLNEPRCPECGFRFNWAEVLDPARRKHAFLFEHHPEANLWSFARTLWAGLNRRRFWSSLHPAQTLRPRRLLIYATLCTLPYLLAAGWSVQSIFGTMYWIPSMLRWRHSSLVDHAIPILWPILIFAGLLVFQISMRRARIRTAHVLRCVIYSADVLLWGSLVLLVVLGANWVWEYLTPSPAMRAFRPPPLSSFFMGIWNVLLIIYVIETAARLHTAYQRYLRFDHPMATILAAHVMAFLAILNIQLLIEFGW